MDCHANRPRSANHAAIQLSLDRIPGALLRSRIDPRRTGQLLCMI